MHLVICSRLGGWRAAATASAQHTFLQTSPSRHRFSVDSAARTHSRSMSAAVAPAFAMACRQHVCGHHVWSSGGAMREPSNLLGAYATASSPSMASRT